MKITFHKLSIFLVLKFCFYSNGLYCFEKIFSEYYKIQKGDNVETIVRKKIWFKSLKPDEKKKVINDIKKWNPQINNWKNLEIGSQLYLEFPRKWSKEFPLITIPSKRLALQKDPFIKTEKNIDRTKNKNKEENKRIPSSRSAKTSYNTKIVYQKNPYNFDLSLGTKLFYYEETVTFTGSKIATTNIVFDLDFKFNYPVNEKFQLFFGLGGSYYQSQECENSNNYEGYCNTPINYDFPLSYSLEAGLKKAIFSSTLAKGFSGLLTIEREGISYLSTNKAIVGSINTEDGATLLKPNKSLYLWLTLGLDYNFSIWNRPSQLSASGSYCLSGESILNTSGSEENGGYWERLEPCLKLKGQYKQNLSKNFWFNSYIKYVSARGKFDYFTGIQNGLNLGYTF